MSMSAKLEAQFAELATLTPEEFESADVNLLLKNYTELSDKLARKLFLHFKKVETSGLQQRKFIEAESDAVKTIGALLAQATQKWLIQSADDFADDVAEMILLLPKLENVSPALRSFALEGFDDFEAPQQKAILKFYGVRKADQLPTSGKRKSAPVNSDDEKPVRKSRKEAPVNSDDEKPVRKTSKSTTQNLRDVGESMDASEDNLAVISIFGAGRAKASQKAAREIDITLLKNSSIKRFVKALAAPIRAAEIEELKARFARRHADLLQSTASTDDSSTDAESSEEKPVRKPAKKNGFADKIEEVIGDKEEKEEKHHRHHSHPRESSRLTNSDEKKIVRRRPASADVEEIRNVRRIRRPE